MSGVWRVAAGGGTPELAPGANPPNSLTAQATLSADGKVLAIFTEALNPESKTYSNRIVFPVWIPECETSTSIRFSRRYSLPYAVSKMEKRLALAGFHALSSEATPSE
jgi:hypothetical protein